jgi:hypothetical protein
MQWFKNISKTASSTKRRHSMQPRQGTWLQLSLLTNNIRSLHANCSREVTFQWLCDTAPQSPVSYHNLTHPPEHAKALNSLAPSMQRAAVRSCRSQKPKSTTTFVNCITLPCHTRIVPQSQRAGGQTAATIQSLQLLQQLLSS